MLSDSKNSENCAKMFRRGAANTVRNRSELFDSRLSTRERILRVRADSSGEADDAPTDSSGEGVKKLYPERNTFFVRNIDLHL
jgi:formylmethanofuran dehydrogenase subunit E